MQPDSAATVVACEKEAGAGPEWRPPAATSDHQTRLSPDPTTPVVALADTRWLGHHPTYFREFTASLRRLGARVIALCPQPDDLAPDEGVRAGKLDSPNGSLLAPGRFDNDPAATAFRWWRTRVALEAVEDRTGWRTDFVFFPYLDNYLRFLPSILAPDLLLGRPWSGLYFRNQHLGGPAHGAWTALRSLAKGDRLLRSSSALPFIGVLDERFNAALSQRSRRQALQFPDITDETVPTVPTELADTLRAQARGRPTIGLAGSLEKRKGLLNLLRVALAARGRDDWFFAAVGPFARWTFSPAELAFIEDSRRQLGDSLYLDPSAGWIPDGAPYNAIVQSFDIAWAAYEDFQGSSNTLTKASIFEKPVIATAGECIAQRVADFRLGLDFPQGDVAGGLAAVRALVRQSDLTGQPLRSRFADYRQFHSRVQLDATFRRLIGSLRS